MSAAFQNIFGFNPNLFEAFSEAQDGADVSLPFLKSK
jgi:hypothetical protein